MRDVLIGLIVSFPTTPFFLSVDTEALGRGSTAPGSHSTSRVPCPVPSWSQARYGAMRAPPPPPLGGSLAFLGTDVGWDLAFPGSNRHERKPLSPELGLTMVRRGRTRCCPDWNTGPSLIPCSRSFSMRAEQAPGTEATAPRTNHSPRSVSMDFAIRVTGDGCKAYGGAGNFLLKIKFKKENLKKINVRISQNVVKGLNKFSFV